MRDELVRIPNVDKVCLGRSICTVYRRNQNQTCGIWNFGYCPLTEEFYYNKNIHLPEELVRSFEGAGYTAERIRQMESVGIRNGDDFASLVSYYEEAKKQEEEQKNAKKPERSSSPIVKAMFKRI